MPTLMASNLLTVAGGASTFSRVVRKKKFLFARKRLPHISVRVFLSLTVRHRNADPCRLSLAFMFNAVRNMPMTMFERAVVMYMQQIFGTNWDIICKYVPGRDRYTVKNHFYNWRARERRNLNRQKIRRASSNKMTIDYIVG
jgi:hypothetical protein